MDGKKMPASTNFEDRTQEDKWQILSRQNASGELKDRDPYFLFLRKRLYDDYNKVGYHWMRLNSYKEQASDLEPQWQKEWYEALKRDLAEDIAEKRKLGPIGRWKEKRDQEKRDQDFEVIIE